eukprot:TRINITY_DN3770_c0_g1_i3.p1 TRINITY_DN3770_c0_g1~~TRINITY_DN3770_c0_g1_i3.p1  ORF type:complete len:243 (-),score=86.35 TRINITY_DN3770_c0_g1_i3:54-782(-)
MAEKTEVINKELDELKKNWKQKLDLRAINLQAKAIDQSKILQDLDKSVKKNSALIRKLRNITDENKESLIIEIKQLNLSRFVSEIVNVIIESILKAKNILAIVEICSIIHQRYSNFITELLPTLIQTLTKDSLNSNANTSETENEKNTRSNQKRALLRLLTEFVICGLSADSDLLFNILYELCTTDQFKDPNFNNLNLVVSFCRSSAELLGLTSKPILARFLVCKIKYIELLIKYIELLINN